MHVLPVGTALSELHQKALGRTEETVGGKESFNSRLMDRHSGDNLLHRDERFLSCQETLREEDPPVCRVIEGSFQEGGHAVLPCHLILG